MNSDDIYERIDGLQVLWNNENNKIRDLWDTYKRITKAVLKRMKATMRIKMKHRYATISKISTLLRPSSDESHMIFVAEAPGTSILPFINGKNVIHAQSYIKDLDDAKSSNAQGFTNDGRISNLNSEQHDKWHKILSSKNVINLNRDVKAGKDGVVFLNGDLMDSEMVSLSIESALDEIKVPTTKIFSCDAGVNPERMKFYGFDSWKILINIIDAPRARDLHIIVCKVQNCLRIDDIHQDVRLSSLVKKCKDFADFYGYKLNFKKIIGSWLGNEEIYACFSKQEFLHPENPLNSISSGVEELEELLKTMIEYTKTIVENINTDISDTVARGGRIY